MTEEKTKIQISVTLANKLRKRMTLGLTYDDIITELLNKEVKK